MNGKWKFFISRLLQTLLTLWVIATILFFLFRLMPGNPLAAYIDPTFTREQQEILLQQFGLDKPLWQQYFIYFGNLFQGNLGHSFFYKESVISIIGRVLPNTIYLMTFSLIIAYVIGTLGGVLLAWKRGTKTETLGIILTLFTRSAPQFWVGMVVLAFFAFTLKWFPSAGVSPAGTMYTSELDKLFSLAFYQHLFLPSLTLAIYLLGLPLLLMRSNMLDVMGEQFVDMARMRGLKEWRIMLKYAARNAALPVITAMAVGIGYSIGGNVVIENVFSWPGLGRLLVNAVSASDYPLAQGAFILIAAVMVTMNFIADILYSILDPRVTSRR
ncbi:ABC transporter permease [Bacillus horti]|uniref:Peptide/nickel transport system permease protein n=1 Tax=Caldalkalibacillus horti TaxID=77523 RepID=A0ABT9VY70_9BACI|nr:ABC transporter permease [Bacillus horti]MDQ0165937.1 peptide/nickel transport system permease protein [Bacillus horti]